ncbi:hypothetical protein PY092_17480 [Muricauda sp. 334s03]|uniref:Uncharacterized protein n=1 Tax=Flagellimonas yonaguniensis TaxID=3031325 RepID=A0ABT5Y3P6_9FLAO|nr:hypothetical protein [[Muricauda] yonaguniensis]MDF0717959.1 hypothetical protein [[Muricauda] yonaguniensis]
MHKLKGFNHNREYHGKGQLKQFDHSNYVIKVYDKAKQYSIKDKNILRFELKFLKQKEFQNLGIINLQDLKCKVKLRRLFDLLLQRFDELTIIDEIADSSSILKEDRIKLLEYMTPTFWEEKLNGVHTQIKSRHRDKFNSILDKYDLLKTKRVLRYALVNKFNYLIDN